MRLWRPLRAIGLLGAALALLVSTTTIAAGADAFPVEIRNKFGTTEIPAAPTRVVTLGYSEQDPVLALGVKPIAVREWFGNQPSATWPWARGRLGGARPTVLNMPFGSLSYERIAALRPDLIVATHSGITREEYGRLSQIAPTLAQPGSYPDFGVPWQEQTRLIGRALGREARARQLVAGVEAQVASARRRAPELQGKTVAWASPAEGGQYWAVGRNTPPMRFLAALGLRVPKKLGAVVGTKDSARISQEQLPLLDADVLIWQVSTAKQRAAIQADSVYRTLDVARQGRAIFFVGLDDPLYGALSFSTVLSVPYALDRLVPKLTAAVDRERTTKATMGG